MPTARKSTTDHRTLIGAKRREKMRRRLVESAMLVFAEKGVDASVIDDVIVAADVSRGTFYHYFRTNSELLAAASDELFDELVAMIEERVGSFEDPALRIASGLRIYLSIARRYPLFALFVCRAGIDTNSPTSRLYKYLPLHIGEGIDRGRFAATDPRAALDLISGTALVAAYRLAASKTPSDYPEQVVQSILLGLGLPLSQAKKLIAAPLSPLKVPKDSLLERSHARSVYVDTPLA